MQNKKIHFTIITVLTVLLSIYTYQRFKKVQEVEEISAQSDKKVHDVVLEVGNCYSYEEDGVYYGIILIKIEEDIDLFTVGIIDAVEKRELNIINFRNGSLICTKSEFIKGYKVSGLWTGTFSKEDLQVFRQKFKYVGNLDLDKLKVMVSGGGSLIVNSEIGLKDLHKCRLLKGMQKYTNPLKNYVEK